MIAKTSGAGRGSRGRPRSAGCHEAVLGAVASILASEGYGAVTIEGVARQAGVGKQTIYRWWRSRAEVVLEAYATHAESMLPVPDRGSLREDLEAFMVAAFLRLNAVSGPTMRGLMADAVLDPEFLELMREVLIARRRDSLRQLLERGSARGELVPGTDLELLIDLLFGALWHRLLLCHAPLDEAFAQQVVGVVLDGAGRAHA